MTEIPGWLSTEIRTETKGSMSSMDLTKIELAKIECAEKLFNSISTAKVKYHKVTSYSDLLDEMGKEC